MSLSAISSLAIATLPWVATLGGFTLIVTAILHLTRKVALPGVAPNRALPPLSLALLGIALFGIGGTFLITNGIEGYGDIYTAWLVFALISGAVLFVGDKTRM